MSSHVEKHSDLLVKTHKRGQGSSLQIVASRINVEGGTSVTMSKIKCDLKKEQLDGRYLKERECGDGKNVLGRAKS